MKLTIAPSLVALPTIDYRKLKDLQGDLKELNDTSHQKLINSLTEFGFFIPFFVWRDGEDCYIADGHQRTRVLKKAKARPYQLPYVEIQAADRIEAKKKLLVISSQYGRITQEGFDAFTIDIDQEWKDQITNFDAFFKPEEIKINEKEIPDFVKSKSWFLNIEFSDEKQCQKLYEELIEKGYNCKILQ